MATAAGSWGVAAGRKLCPHSVANFNEARVTNLSLALEVDFSKQIFFGTSDLKVEVQAGAAPTHVFFDVLALSIQNVTDGNGEPLEWQVSKPEGLKAQYGDCLAVKLPSGAASAPTTCRVQYETTDKSTAACWLRPEQTQGKRHPWVFTQSQAICGRSFMPCQDTPCVKQAFTMRMTVPAPLTAVASGQPVGDVVEDAARGVRTFTYKQDIPVMSYLLSVVIGDLSSAKIGPRSTVYAEPAVIGAAEAEYKDIVEDYLVGAQEIVGGSDYVWETYNLAVMPTSFGYGGMENPNCTFISASLIAGDRSLTTTLAHEIVHSWTGNLVTNAYWKDFWLNEGFTRYNERRILGKLFGTAFRSLVMMVGYGDLVKSIEMLTKSGTPELTCLDPSIDHIDPDQAFSRVPYEKGSLFLFHLEQVVGGEEKMTNWMRAYVEAYRGQSIETSDFQEHFKNFFKDTPGVDKIDWNHWINGTGLPDFNLEAACDQSLLRRSRELADSWLAGGDGCTSTDIEGMKAQQIMLLLDHLIDAANSGKPPSKEALASMEDKYKLSATRNVEVSFRWCVLCCKGHWEGGLAPTQAFLALHGRGIYVKPLYIAFHEFMPDQAQETFLKHRGFYMAPIARNVASFLGV